MCHRFHLLTGSVVLLNHYSDKLNVACTILVHPITITVHLPLPPCARLKIGIYTRTTFTFSQQTDSLRVDTALLLRLTLGYVTYVLYFSTLTVCLFVETTSTLLFERTHPLFLRIFAIFEAHNHTVIQCLHRH